MDEQKLKSFGAVISKLIRRENLSEADTYSCFQQILANEQPELHQGAFLAALVSKEETTDEISGAWRAIDEIDTRHIAVSPQGMRVENSGTGMDTLKTFNVSSAAAVVAAACGITMTRHGSRALTSVCGTVDILEAIGLDVECDITVVADSIATAGIGLFNGLSPHIHPGALGRILSQIRFGSTLNIAASLANPARPTHGLRGVYSGSLLNRVAQVMRQIGYLRGMVVHGRCDGSPHGMDEISIAGPTQICEFSTRGELSRYEIRPEDVGLKTSTAESVSATGDLQRESLRFIEVLSGRRHDACQDFVCLNAGAILYLTDQAKSIEQGVTQAREAIAHHRAIQKMRMWIGCQHRYPQEGLNHFDALVERSRR